LEWQLCQSALERAAMDQLSDHLGTHVDLYTDHLPDTIDPPPVSSV